MTLKTGVMADENSALHTGIHYILKYNKIENSFFIVIISHNITVFSFFDQINVVLMSKRYFFKKH